MMVSELFHESVLVTVILEQLTLDIGRNNRTTELQLKAQVVA